MNKIEILAISRIKELAKQIEQDAIVISSEVGISKKEFNADKYSYPISSKAREIENWVLAIEENNQ